VNLVYDLAPEKLLADLEVFVDQIPEVDYLNFFVTSLKYVLGRWRGGQADVEQRNRCSEGVVQGSARGIFVCYIYS
jgi:hypothetical protein